MRHFGRRNPKGDEVVGQAEELLSGHAVDGYRRRGARAPAWAHVNVLAHQPYEELVWRAARAGGGHPSTWDFAVNSLALDLIRLHLRGMALPELQAAALIPLELDLLASRVADPATPAALTTLVRGALDQHSIGM